MKYHIIMDENVAYNHHLFNSLRFKIMNKVFEKDLYDPNVKYDKNGNCVKKYQGHLQCDGIDIYAVSNKDKKDVIKLQIIRKED